MSHKITTKLIVFFGVSLLLFAPRLSSAYMVSGLVEFSYRDYETKVGSYRTNYTTFTQTYLLNVATPIYDPRFLLISGGIGYDIVNVLSANNPDYDVLTYHLNMQFFPASMIGWNLYGRKTVNTYQNSSIIAGYDITTTSYGGDMHLSLSKGDKGTNNNNNNYYPNNTTRSFLPRPDINLSYDHTEAESPGGLVPIDETRDHSHGDMRFVGMSYSLSFIGDVENYKNLTGNASSYDTVTLGVQSTIRIAQDGELVLYGRQYDRTTENIGGYDQHSSGDNYSAYLTFKEKKNFSHFYRYEFSHQTESSREMTSNKLDTQVTYRMSPEFRFLGGVKYYQAEYIVPATNTTVAQNSELKSGGLFGGGSYFKQYQPEFLGPFALNTGYDFTSGFSSFSSDAPGVTVGAGYYYGNHADIGLSSVGWKDETVTLNYTFDNKRDHSPVALNEMSQAYRLLLLTRRMPRTSMQASASYVIRQYATTISNPFDVTQGNQSTMNRSWVYNVDINHALTQELGISAGASKSNTASASSFTLSTLDNRTLVDNERFYVAVNYNTTITRNVTYQLELRRELNRESNVDTDVNHVRMTLNYRIRAILIGLEYRWHQETPENGLTTTQQYTFAKISRPF